MAQSWLLLPLLPFCLSSTDIDGPTLVRLAKQVVRAEVVRSAPASIPDLGTARPVFVTIERKNQILGCRGSLVTRTGTLGAEIAAAARAATSHDPRYQPVRKSDLEDFLVTVTVVERLEAISDPSNLRPEHGLVVQSGTKSGIVLPWEGKDPEVRLRWAYQKAGVPVGSPARLSRMIAERWRG